MNRQVTHTHGKVTRPITVSIQFSTNKFFLLHKTRIGCLIAKCLIFYLNNKLVFFIHFCTEGVASPKVRGNSILLLISFIYSFLHITVSQ